MWIGILSLIFSLPALAGLFAGIAEAARAARGRRPVRWERLALAGLVLTGRWWMRYLRRVDPDEPKRLVPARRGAASGRNGVALEWEQFGPDDAPALLLSHGWSLTHDTWYYQKKALAGEFRVIVWDMRGMGRSEAPADGDYSMEALADDLAAVFDATDAGRHPSGCVLVGHSVGAMLLPLFAQRFPAHMARVRGLALVGGTDTPMLETMCGRSLLVPMRSWFWEPFARAMIRVPRPFEAFARLCRQMGCVHAALMFGTHVGHDSRGQDDLLAWRCASFSMRAAGAGALACFAFDARAAMKDILVPTLLLAGLSDRNAPPDIQRAMAARLQHPHLVLIAECGHLGLLECHAEISAHLDEFARRCFQVS